MYLMVYVIIIIRSMGAVFSSEQWRKKVEKEIKSVKT